MNKIQLSGRLTADPEIRTFKSKDADGNEVSRTVADFRLAVNVKAGRRQKNAVFIGISAFGKLSEIVAKHCKIGDLIIVEGFLTPNNYEKDGVKIYSFNVVADSIEFTSTGVPEDEKKTENNKDDVPEFMGFSDNLEISAPF